MRVKGNQSPTIQPAHRMGDYMDRALGIGLLDRIRENARAHITARRWWNFRKQCSVRADLLKIRLQSTEIVDSEKSLGDQKAACKYEVLHADLSAPIGPRERNVRAPLALLCAARSGSSLPSRDIYIAAQFLHVDPLNETRNVPPHRMIPKVAVDHFVNRNPLAPALVENSIKRSD